MCHLHAVESFTAISERVALIELNSTIPIGIVAAYAPTNVYSTATKDKFYEMLNRALSDISVSRI